MDVWDDFDQSWPEPPLWKRILWGATLLPVALISVVVYPFSRMIYAWLKSR